MKRALHSVVGALDAGDPLDEPALFEALQEIAAGEAAAGEVGWLLGVLAARSSAADAVAFVRACRRMLPPLVIRGGDRPTINIVGTGGGRPTFNINTTTAFVVAAAGGTVVKTGSGAYGSRSGFAETAGALGVLRRLDLPALESIAREVGIVFVSPVHCVPVLEAMAAAVRPASWRTVGRFINAIGPLLAPVIVDHRVLGASGPRLESLLCEAVRALGEVPSLIVRGEEGIDNVSTIGGTWLTRVDGSGVHRERLVADDLPLVPVEWDDLSSRDPLPSARLVAELLAGRASPQHTDIVALNAAVVLVETALASDRVEAFERCRALIKSGAAATKLADLRAAIAARAGHP